MTIPPAPLVAPRATPQSRACGSNARTHAVFEVEAVGYSVPRTRFSGRVHSTFAQACNIECGDSLLTLVASQAGNGPTTLRLAPGHALDLRRWFETGERVECERGIARSERARIQLAHARVWRPTPQGGSSPTSLLPARLRRAATCLTQQRRRWSSVLDHAAAPTVAALSQACSKVDGPRVARHAARLIGWGEGLTPAGDDFVVGVCAGVVALAGDDARRRALRDTLGATIVASLPRTTRISAHHLSLAAHGHFGQRLLDARDALLNGDSSCDVDAALRAACAIGASSGADTIAGLLCVLCAWAVPAHDAVA
jgi:hypothetical protein